MIASVMASAEERWLVPSYSSPRAGAWIASHRVLTLPFRWQRPVRRYLQRTDAGDGAMEHTGGDDHRDGRAVPRRLTVLAVGGPMRIRRFCETLLGPVDAATARPGWRSAWTPGALAEVGAGIESRTDVVIVEIHHWAMPRFRRAGWLIVPNAVRWSGPLEAVPPPQRSKSLRDDLRKVRQHRYYLEPGDGPADWEAFYTTMIVPQARERFGDAAWIPSRAFLRGLQAVGRLHFVCRGGERVGGFCAVPSGDRVWYPIAGMRGGDERLRREGVMAAIYALGLDWARTHGYRYVDKGRTSAFVNDGIAAYKRKWGLTPVSDPLCQLFALKIAPKAAVAQAFARQPVWVETGVGLTEFTGAAL